ncbi:MAG: ABC transporter ATP-binding protein [Clostridia bacterium]|jgi:putative ABC transport system ATP-binding protein|nr:ABC transporter ATP-binding protein [Clostridia bacterium]NLV33796.1 ABC transporter ATP-binding protein [Clostridiaceae bacterium]MDD4502866.1 ABC transporter ATP-binding protein [Clostridia bacterium]HPB16611.1 ABC transporter ATP-binding protein [Clostridia bacterium]HQM95664.1 ABC transporter ATP-binding protein [Clostridia bacterium]
MTALLETVNICRDFKQANLTVHALVDVNISIEPGTLTMLAGRSGSGKTTLMNIAGALDRPSSGTIFFHGKEISSLSDNKRDEIRRNNMGFVFQSVALISVLTAYENVEFGLRMAGIEPARWDNLVRESLKFVGLEKRLKHKPHQLSGGEQQRVAIARAIASRPKLVFADEPTAELDTKTGLKIVNLFRHLVDEEKMTIVMTTHDPSMIELADNVIRLEDGRVV